MSTATLSPATGLSASELLDRAARFACDVVAPNAAQWERERRMGREAFAQAAAADPKRLLFQLDLALLAELPRGEGASGRGRLERISQATAATAEEREVQRRAQAALAR